MRLKLAASLPIAAAFALTGCVAPTGPIEVTRFHAPELASQGRGTIAVVPAPQAPALSGDIEQRTYAAAIARELQRLGYREVAPGSGDQVAEVRVERRTWRPERARGPVSVGVGGSTGSYGSGVGLGLGIDLSGPPPAVTETRLGLVIRSRASGAPLWEGRASFTVRADSPLATTSLGAAQMASALLRDFPGASGQTVLVRPTR